MIYRGTGFLAVVWLAFSPPPQSASYLSFSVLMYRRVELSAGEKRDGRSFLKSNQQYEWWWFILFWLSVCGEDYENISEYPSWNLHQEACFGFYSHLWLQKIKLLLHIFVTGVLLTPERNQDHQRAIYFLNKVLCTVPLHLGRVQRSVDVHSSAKCSKKPPAPPPPQEEWVQCRLSDVPTCPTQFFSVILLL